MGRKKQSKTETPIVSDSPVTYAVPGEVAVALNTGRSQFIDGLVKRVRAGHVIEPVQVIGMLELIRDWTNAKYADDRRNVIVRENLAALGVGMLDLRVQVTEMTKKLHDTVGTAHRVAIRHGSGPLNIEDEVD